METFLFVVIERIMDSRDQWQREAERLSATGANVLSTRGYTQQAALVVILVAATSSSLTLPSTAPYTSKRA
jgi:hypothetical protein